MNVFRITKYKRKGGKGRICKRIKVGGRRRRVCKSRSGWRRYNKRIRWLRFRRRWLLRYRGRWWRLRHRGCYKDSRKRLLNKVFKRLSRNSRQNCARLCRKKGFRLMGLQYTRECFCANKFSRKGRKISRRN